jgi:hypothetical protein
MVDGVCGMKGADVIDKHAVAQAIAVLEQHGKKPTHRAVLEQLGTGSLRDVGRFMKELTADGGLPTPATATLIDAEALIEPVIPLAEMLLQYPALLALERYLRDVTPGQFDHAQQDLAALQLQREALVAECQRLQATREGLQRDGDGLRQALHELRRGAVIAG